jgi:hypothetical protein
MIASITANSAKGSLRRIAADDVVGPVMFAWAAAGFRLAEQTSASPRIPWKCRQRLMKRAECESFAEQVRIAVNAGI